MLATENKQFLRILREIFCGRKRLYGQFWKDIIETFLECVWQNVSNFQKWLSKRFLWDFCGIFCKILHTFKDLTLICAMKLTNKWKTLKILRILIFKLTFQGFLNVFQFNFNFKLGKSIKLQCLNSGSSYNFWNFT